MTEGVTIRARVSARWSIRFLVVTHSARRDLTACVRFTRWGVTGVAIVMRRDIRGNRQTNTAIDRRAMTSAATALRAR